MKAFPPFKRARSLRERRLFEKLKTPIRVALWVCLLGATHASAWAAPAAGGVRYTLSPVVTGTAWDEKIGLDDGLLFGGKLGMDFGQAIGLEASYLTSAWLSTDFSAIGLTDTAGSLVPDGRVRVRRIGADLLIRLPTQRFALFVKGGGGIVRFEPEVGEHADRIETRVGAGLGYVLNQRLRARAWAELSRLRLDRYALAPGGASAGAYPLDPEAEKSRSNASVGLSLDYALGQARFARRAGLERVQPFSHLELEPFAARFDFDDASLPIYTVAGARLGGELNPYVGWGLYYWRAVASDLSDTRPLQSYGGEARFGLSSTTGPQPYLVLGLGQIDFLKDFRDANGNRPDDRTALILGAGVRAGLASGLDLNVSARDYMFSQARLDRVSGTDEIKHNWMFAGAVVFGIGRRGGSAAAAPAAPIAPAVPVASGMPVSQPGSRPGAEAAAASQVATPAAGDTIRVEPSATSKGYISGQQIVIPVPLEGEVYIRYGKPATESGSAVKVPSVQPVPVTPDTTLRAPESTKPDTQRVTPTPAPPAPATPGAPASESSADTSAATGSTVSRREVDSLLGALQAQFRAESARQAAEADSARAAAVDSARQAATDSVRQAAAESARQAAAADSARRTAAAQSTPAAAADTSTPTATAPREQDSLVTALKSELSATRDRLRQDSLRALAAADSTRADSARSAEIQQAVSRAVSEALAAQPKGQETGLSQAEASALFGAMTRRLDSLSAGRAAVDSAWLRDQIELEVTRRTKSQDEYERALENVMARYAEQERQTATPPAIVVTQPAAPTPVLERPNQTTVVLKPDTQFVVIRDSARQTADTALVHSLEAAPAPEQDFLDLNPAGYVAFGLDRPRQFVLGGRLDIGKILARNERLFWVPEFALGLGGGGVSVMAVINAEYRITTFDAGKWTIRPYVRAGFGVLGASSDLPGGGTEGVLNLTYGLHADPRQTSFLASIGGPALFVEHQIIDLFDLNRLALGLQWSP